MRNLPDVNSAAVTKAPTHVSRQAMSTSGRNLKMTAKRAHVLPPEGLPTRRDPLRPQCRELPRRSLHRGRRQISVINLDPKSRRTPGDAWPQRGRARSRIFLSRPESEECWRLNVTVWLNNAGLYRSHHWPKACPPRLYGGTERVVAAGGSALGTLGAINLPLALMRALRSGAR